MCLYTVYNYIIFFSITQDLFFQYPWNNFLHLYVESSISIVLSSSYPIPLDTNDDTGQPNDSITLRQHVR